MTVPRRLAVALNTLNVLAPALLFLAVVLASIRAIGTFSPEIRQLLLQHAAMLVALALLIRTVWGISIFVLRRRTKEP